MSAFVDLIRRNLPQLMGDEPSDDGEAQGGILPEAPSGYDQVRQEGESACGLCGRTLLAGETTELYRENGAETDDPDDPLAEATFVVCAICRPSARQHGYRRIA